MIDDLVKILYSQSELNSIWSFSDNEIWKKYFLADEKINIGKSIYYGVPIKVPPLNNISHHGIFFYSTKSIDKSVCHKNILYLVNKVKGIIYNLFDNLCTNLISSFIYIYDSYSRSDVIKAIKENTFIKVSPSNFLEGDFIVDLKNVIENSQFDSEIVSWNTYYYQINSTIAQKYLKLFNVTNCSQLNLLLHIIVDFFDLEKQLQGKKEDCLVGGNKYYEKYIRHKKMYIHEKNKLQILSSKY